MLTWSYFAALLTDPGEVPIGWHPFPDDAVSLAVAHKLLTGHMRLWQRAASTACRAAADPQLSRLHAERAETLCVVGVVSVHADGSTGAGAAAVCGLLHRQTRPPAAAVLQALQVLEAGAHPPLQRHGALCAQNGGWVADLLLVLKRRLGWAGAGAPVAAAGVGVELRNAR